MADSPTMKRVLDHSHLASIADLTQLRVCVAVVETANFSAAARRLSMSPSTVSRHISDLEARLGAMLVSRTTRQLVVTDIGRKFYQRCITILDELGLAEEEAEQLTREPKGVLHLTAPAVLAQRHISPYLPEFMRQYPDIAVNMVLTSQMLDLISEGIDVAIRIAAKIDPNFVAIKLAPNKRIFAASPEYIKLKGAPKSPEDLLKHNCLTSRFDPAGVPWHIREGKLVREVRVKGNLVADNGEILLESTLQGVGIAMLPMFLASPYLRRQQLVTVLDNYTVELTSMYAVLPHRKYVPRKTRCFVEFVKQLFANPAPWDR
jgi:DNA-binding transcriptional LysR family regulator